VNKSFWQKKYFLFVFSTIFQYLMV